VVVLAFTAISIRALRGEGDEPVNDLTQDDAEFQSAPSAGRATIRLMGNSHDHHISIRALRGEGDTARRTCFMRNAHFNPRPPRGGRRLPIISLILQEKFQSTPSARRATVTHSKTKPRSRHFNPRPPRGGRPRCRPRRASWPAISIHALREEGDCKECAEKALNTNFNPRPPRGGRLCPMFGAKWLPRFQSTPSARRATVKTQ